MFLLGCYLLLVMYAFIGLGFFLAAIEAETTPTPRVFFAFVGGLLWPMFFGAAIANVIEIHHSK